MNTERRVLIVTRHFWPTTTDRTLRLSHWGAQLSQAGGTPTILTTRPSTSWPRQICLGATPVVRLNAPSSNPLRSHRYGRQLVDWISKEIHRFDCLYFDEPGLEAATVLSHFPKHSRPPVVVRYDHAALSRGDREHWRPGKQVLEVCRAANAIVAPNASSHQSLLAAGIIHTPVVRMEGAVGKSLDRSIRARRLARQTLSDLHHDLFSRSTDRVVVCPGELSQQWGIDFLFKALGGIVERQRHLRLWVLGDGPERPRLYRELQHHGLHRLIALPGIFTDLEEVLQVADLCVFPAACEGLSWLAPTCAASNIPVLVADCPEARTLCDTEASTLTFDAGKPETLRAKMEHWLRDSTPWSRAALQLQKTSVGMQDPRSEVRYFLDWIDQQCIGN